MLTKRELMQAYMTYDGIDGHLWDLWFYQRLYAAGYSHDRHDKQRDLWKKILHEMPKFYIIDISVSEQRITFEYEGGEDVYELSKFHDKEENPVVVKMLERHSYWDGPISGIAEYKGERLYYDLIHEDDLDGNRKYALYRLNDDNTPKEDEIVEEFYWHEFEHYQKPRR